MDPDLIGKVGLPIALTVVLVAFFLRTVFPYMAKQVDGANARTDAAFAALAGIKENQIQQTEVHRQMVRAMEILLERSKRD